ncbi:hypothetical protein Tco_1523934 [Tanacetum coccineum]
MESLNSKLQEREMYQMQLEERQMKSNGMACFKELESHLSHLYHKNLFHEVIPFKMAFLRFFNEDHEILRKMMLRNLDQSNLLVHLDILENFIEKSVLNYGEIRMKENEVKEIKETDKPLNEAIPHEHEIEKSFKLQSKDVQINLVQAVDANLVVTESSRTKLDKQDTSSRSGNDVNTEDAVIRPVNDQELLAEVQLTAQHNVLANEQQHYMQSEPIYDTHLLVKVDRNTIPDSTNMSLKDGQHGQILNETSNKAKIKKEIEVLETINIELEQSVAKLLAENEKLHKENEHLKQTYKYLYDSIKTTRVQTKDHNDSLIAQINSKTVENADLKAQIQEKVFANVAMKNELRKLKGNSVDTKFAKPSIFGKPVLQPPRNQSVVRQPNAFKSERPNFSKPRFASQVDVNNILSKPVTPYYLPKVIESMFVKPHHAIASSLSRNSSKEVYWSNDMAHNYYLEEAKKKTQDKNMNLKPSVMHTTILQNTTNGCKPKPRSNNQTSRSLPVSKSSCEMSNGVPLVDHSRNSSSFLDSKHFVCSTCQKCVFNANHDACLTKFLKEVNSRIKVQSPKTINSIKPVEKITNVIKPKRWISKGYRFSPNKSSAVHEKTNTPRSCLRWKPTGRIFNTVGLAQPRLTVNPQMVQMMISLTHMNAIKLLINQGFKKFIFDEQELWRLQTTLQAPLLKEKKSVRFSALYLQKKRNLLVS